MNFYSEKSKYGKCLNDILHYQSVFSIVCMPNLEANVLYAQNFLPFSMGAVNPGSEGYEINM